MSSFRDDPIDSEIVGLMDALNSIPGVTTQASCCGHGADHFYCWLQCSTIESVVAVSMVFQGRVRPDGTRTHYRTEVAPFRLMVRDESQLDTKGNVVLGADGLPVRCVNLVVESDDMCGACVDIGFEDEKSSVEEFHVLETVARGVAKELTAAR